MGDLSLGGIDTEYVDGLVVLVSIVRGGLHDGTVTLNVKLARKDSRMRVLGKVFGDLLSDLVPDVSIVDV